MDSLRVVLIIIGMIVIVGLVIHGVLTLRNNNQTGQGRSGNPKRKQVQDSTTQSDLLSGVDESDEHSAWGADDDFDELGLSKVKTRKPSARATAERVTDDVEPEAIQARASTVQVPQESSEASDSHSASDNEVAQQSQHTSESSAEQPMQAAQENTAEPELPSLRANRDEGTVEQMAIDLAAAETNEEVVEPPQEEVITLFVSGDIKGTTLLETVTELGMKFGDLDIFHRFEQPSGRGPLLFRMANMYNPGTFDLDNIESFTTRGVVLFMALPIKYDGHKAFTMMYNAANKIADAMPRAAVLDGNRNPMTKQSVQHTYQKIREFERRMRLAGLRQEQ
ncbi:cell division protein ZipA [Aliidiomarina sp.]|uniref:cell division protein ZipA n=1 Tax=Aliidiomarina sp. TaxID=1872439 RepID=UPI003A4E190B